MVEEALVEDIGVNESKKGQQMKKVDIVKPEGFEQITLDLACAMYLKHGEDLQSYFNKHSQN